MTLMPASSLWQRTALAVADWRAPSVTTPRGATLAASAAVAVSLATFAVVRAWQNRKGARTL